MVWEVSEFAAVLMHFKSFFEPSLVAQISWDFTWNWINPLWQFTPNEIDFNHVFSQQILQFMNELNHENRIAIFGH